MTECKIEGCSRPPRPGGHRICAVHKMRLYRTGRAALPSRAERLWDKVDRSDPDGCWLWTGSVTRKGYGRAQDTQGRTRNAQRVAWELAHEVTLPKHLFVCHHCDVPLCVRVDHLFVSTNAGNLADMAAKGRDSNRKLTDAQVRELRRLYAQGWATKRLAQDFGLHITSVHRIVTGRSYRFA